VTVRIVALTAETVRWPIAGTGAARGRSERAAVIVEMRSAGGATGLGEAAPLPGMSPDALGDAQHAIALFARLVPFEVVDRDAAHLLVASTTPSPAARFALETALFDALAREQGISLAALLCAPTERRRPGTRAGVGAASGSSWRPAVPLAAVVDDPGAARAAYTAGIRCLKIKLGAEEAPEVAADRVRAIAAAAPGAALRLDANRLWPIAEVAARLAALAPLCPEYVEEPCRDAHRLLGTALPCRLALDESLADLDDDQIAAALRGPGLAAVVLKPVLLGGLTPALALASQARAAGVAAVASHALEGPIGTAACAELALALGDARAAGLAPHPALAGWRLAVPQLTADHVRAAGAPGLGFAALDLVGAVQACEARARGKACAP
jgi:o-succinylbenzoate synthase